MDQFWNLAVAVFLFFIIETLEMRPDEEIYRELDNAEIIGDMIFEPTSSRMAKRSRQNWPDGIIPYVISTNVPTNLRDMILNATNYVNEYTCLRFRPADMYTDNYWVRFLMQENADPNQICSSYIGWLNRKDQGIFVGKRCFFGSMLHELLHTVGFYHEHTRNDRDQFIRVNKSNFASTAVVNNYKLDKESCRSNEECVFDDYEISYNYESIMHYCPYCGSKDTNYPVFTPINKAYGIGDPNKIGQRQGFSRGDWLMINKKYGCNMTGDSQPDDLPSEPMFQDPHEVYGPDEHSTDSETSMMPSTTPISATTTVPKLTNATTTGKSTYCSVIPFHPCRFQ